MKRTSNLSKFDVTERNRRLLNDVLEEEVQAAKAGGEIQKVTVTEALEGETHYEAPSSRETTRILFISQDTSLLNQSTQSLDGYLNLSDVFDEVHILILQHGLPPRNPVLRVAPNVWMYVVSAQSWWDLFFESKKMIYSQLVFAEGFRPDVIVARDVFESGFLAHWASNKFGRVVQMHVLADVFHDQFFKRVAHPRLRKFLRDYSLRRCLSIRTATDTLCQKVKSLYPDCIDVAALPRFYNFAAIAKAQVAVDIKKKYQQFSFIILYIGPLHFDSSAYQAIDAAHYIMRNPKVGLVIVGAGDAKGEFQKRAELLGISTQVVFENTVDDIASYLKTASVLLVTDIDDRSDEVVVHGAAAGVPLIVANTPQRVDLFGVSQAALFFETGDIMGMTTHLNTILNDLSLRVQLPAAARAAVEARLHEDPLIYKLAFRDSIEAALFIGEETNDESEVSS